MDTVYNYPFEAYLIINPNTSPQKVSLGPWYEALSHIPSENICARIEENDEIDLYFNSSDSSARLYLDALECCPTTSRIMVDDEGLLFCNPADDVIKIYRSDTNYDALRVDTLQISIICNNNVYFSWLNVVPKQLSNQEWTIMRNDLENEIRGLAQDIVRRNIGVGDEMQGILPPDDLYAFLIINKNAQAITSALLDIKEKPKYKLSKCYEEVDESKNKEIDTETVKRYLRKGTPRNKLMVPRRNIVYDIPENRLLKKIVKTYDEKLARFISVINSTLCYRKQRLSKYPGQSYYDTKYIEGLQSYLETAEKLKMITSIIKNAEWFQEVKCPQEVFIPHSVAVDSRYGTLYRMYTEINKRNFSIQFDPQYSYSWKKSSSLYEMWCYICVCRSFLKKYSPADASLGDIFTKDHLFPFLESGTKITLEDEYTKIEVVYDPVLPRKSTKVQAYQNPLFIIGKHNRPDICINLYSKKSNWYVGSFVVECKYRNLEAFWYGKTWSSREQIIAYHNDSKSPLFFNGSLDGITSSRPVHQVWVFTPDEFETKVFTDNKVQLVTFRPSEDRKGLNDVCENLINAVQEQLTVADNFYNRFFLNSVT